MVGSAVGHPHEPPRFVKIPSLDNHSPASIEATLYWDAVCNAGQLKCNNKASIGTFLEGRGVYVR